MINTLIGALIGSAIIIYFLILVLISQLSDLSKYEERINKAKEFIKNHIIATETEEILLEILEDEDDE